MVDLRPQPTPLAIIYQDADLYACVAVDPIVRGHTVVIWKHPPEDLSSASVDEYTRVIRLVQSIQAALQTVLSVKKVYILYTDEAHCGQWHLVPRYRQKSPEIFLHYVKPTQQIVLAVRIRQQLHWPSET